MSTAATTLCRTANLPRTQRDQLLAVMGLCKALGCGWQNEMKSNLRT
jgi:hypothetical protein